jgi:predicted HTH domain antitoxin
MSVQISIVEPLFFENRNSHELAQAVREGLIIRDYIEGEISMGEVAELLGLPYMKARDWLHERGIATLKKLPPVKEEVYNKIKPNLPFLHGEIWDNENSTSDIAENHDKYLYDLEKIHG